MVVGARVLVKFSESKHSRLEECIPILNWLLLCAYCIFATVLANLGIGRHQWDITVSRFEEVTRLLNYESALYAPTIFLAKLVILTQYLRIFAPFKKGFTYWATHILIWSNALFYIATFFVVLFQCIPRTKIWRPSVSGRCIDIDAEIITNGAWNVASDIAILLLPIRAIWQLKLSRRKKLEVSGVFAIGLLYVTGFNGKDKKMLTGPSACVSSACNLYFRVKFYTTSDSSFAIFAIGLWSEAEVATAIMCGALPLTPAFIKMCKRKFSHSAVAEHDHCRPSRKHSIDTEPIVSRNIASQSEYADRTSKLNRDYFRLEDFSATIPQVARVDSHVRSEIEGGASDKSTEYGGQDNPFSHTRNPRTGILKTVTIETNGHMV
ncbi:MAG: hypothetical protein Q9190_003612 [Brigantiaea leucoxantha]